MLAYWDAGASLSLDYTRDSDRGFGILYTPAFIVLRRGGAAFEDWDSDEGLRRWAAVAPGRITRTVDGRWRCPPAEAAAAAYGMGHIQHSYADISPCVRANVNYLMACFPAGKRLPGVDKGLAAALVDAVRRNPGITVGDLRLHVEQKVGPAVAGPDMVAEAINVLVIRRAIYVNLRGERLAEPDRARVYGNCGCRGPRYGAGTTTLVEKYVAEYCESECRPTRRTAYDKLRAACNQEGVSCPSYGYFSGRVSAYTCPG